MRLMVQAFAALATLGAAPACRGVFDEHRCAPIVDAVVLVQPLDGGASLVVGAYNHGLFGGDGRSLWRCVDGVGCDPLFKVEGSDFETSIADGGNHVVVALPFPPGRGDVWTVWRDFPRTGWSGRVSVVADVTEDGLESWVVKPILAAAGEPPLPPPTYMSTLKDAEGLPLSASPLASFASTKEAPCVRLPG